MSIEENILPDNPAARLQSMLVRMVDVEFDVNEQVSTVFARVCQIDNEPEKIFPHYSQLFILIQDAYEKVVQFYPNQQKTHLSWKNHLTKNLQSHSPYHHQWKALMDKLQHAHYLDMVQIASDNLAHYVKPTEVYGLTIEKLAEQVTSLIEEIKNSNDLSPYLKVFLSEELSNILNFVRQFDLYGSEPIRKSIYNILANSEVSKKGKSKVVKNLCLFAVTVATAIGVINDAVEFPKSLDSLRSEFLLPDLNGSEHTEIAEDEKSEE